MSRLEGWEARLAAHVQRYRTLAFEWGVADCAVFALTEGVRALTGARLLADEEWRSSIAASRILVRRGHRDVFGLAIELLGAPMENIRYVSRGDVVGFDGGQGPTLGLCLGQSISAPGERGLAFFPRTVIIMAWKV